MYPEILSRFMAGKNFTQNEYKNAWSSISSIRADWMNFTQEFDAVILPTSPILPPNKTKLLSDSSYYCLLYTSPSPRDRQKSRMPSSA